MRPGGLQDLMRTWRDLIPSDTLEGNVIPVDNKMLGNMELNEQHATLTTWAC